MSFFVTCAYLRRNLRAVWPPNASLYASSTCVHLRPLAGPFGQGLMTNSTHIMCYSLSGRWEGKEGHAQDYEKSMFFYGRTNFSDCSWLSQWGVECVLVPAHFIYQSNGNRETFCCSSHGNRWTSGRNLRRGQGSPWQGGSIAHHSFRRSLPETHPIDTERSYRDHQKGGRHLRRHWRQAQESCNGVHRIIWLIRLETTLNIFFTAVCVKCVLSRNHQADILAVLKLLGK